MKKSKFRQDKNPYKSYEKKPADSTVWKHLTWVHAIAALAVVCAVLLAVILGVHHFHVKYPGGMPEAIAARQEKRDTKKTAKEEKKEAKQTAKAEKKANLSHGKTDEEDIAADTDL